MRDVFIYDAVRTPRGKGSAKGALAQIPPHELIRQLITALGNRNGQASIDRIQRLILSCVGQVGAQGGHIALVSRLHAGLHDDVSCLSINNFCVGGLSAIGLAARDISTGLTDLALAGGVECMSQVPFMADSGSYYTDPALADSLSYVPVALGADYLAFREDISRETLDHLTLKSHQRAAAAWAEGHYDSSVVPVTAPNGAIALDRDETIRPDMTVERLSGLAPAFADEGSTGYDAIIQRARPDTGPIDHRHSVANCPPLTDGAGLLLIGTAEVGASLSLQPLARLTAMKESSADPIAQLTAGVEALKSLLKDQGTSLGHYDLIEYMEAFAAVPAIFYRDHDVDSDRVNVNGGHLAMGHPMGATGAILSTTLIHEMVRRQVDKGLVVAHGGSGVGAAAAFERLA